MQFLLLFLIYNPTLLGMDYGNAQKNISVDCDRALIAPFIDDAVESLLKGNLTRLDPLVGETACHIRAARVGDLYTSIISGGTLTDNEKLLLGCMYLLTKARVISENDTGYDECIDTKKLKPLSNQKAKDAVKHAQRFVAADSVIYVRTLAQKIDHPQKTGLIKALEVIRYTDAPFCRPSIACFPTIVVLIEHLKREAFPLVLRYGVLSSRKIVGQQLFILDSSNRYCAEDCTQLVYKKRAFVIEGISSETPVEIRALDPLELLLMSASVHAQFAGKMNGGCDVSYHDCDPKLGSLKLAYEASAKKFDISMKNPKPFFIDHIYAATIAELYQENSLKEQE